MKNEPRWGFPGPVVEPLCSHSMWCRLNPCSGNCHVPRAAPPRRSPKRSEPSVECCPLFGSLGYKGHHGKIAPTDGTYIFLVKDKKCSQVSTLSDHGLQHARPPCPSPTPGVYPNSCPLSRCAILSSHPLSSPSLPALNLSQHQCLFQ